MFGYVKALRDDLTIRQDTFYRAAYCGLCKEMGRCTGQCSRLTLSYDMVFLYLTRTAILKINPVQKKGRCLLHPFKSRQIVQSDSELKYAAKVSSLLAYGKICDDLSDEKGFKRFVKKLLKPFFGSAKRRASLDDLYKVIESHLQKLAELEDKKLPSVDAPAEIFGNLLADVFAYGLDGDNATLAREIGFRCGRYIYATDAADDIEEDRKSGGYNPFLLLYGGEIEHAQKETIEMSMKYDLSALAAAIDLIDECQSVKILKNIVYRGMPLAVHRALYRKSEKEN
ncbi:MAG: hypothetical protein IJC81_00985 [Clostridia bacterium]|nr:hypothetical protein [Clostridia bacterium]